MLKRSGHLLDFSETTHLSNKRRHRSGYWRVAFYGAELIAELLLVSLTFIAMNALFNAGHLRSADLVLLGIILPVYVLSAFYARSYSFRAISSHTAGLRTTLHVWAVTIGITLIVVFTLKKGSDFSRLLLFTSAGVALFGLIAFKAMVIHFVRHRLTGVIYRELVIEDGQPCPTAAGMDRIDVTRFGLSPDINDPISLHNFSTLVDGYDRVFVSCKTDKRAVWSLYLQATGTVGELLMPELSNLGLVNSHRHSGLPSVLVSRGSMDLPDRVIKRLFDLAVAVPLVILTAPLMLLIAIAIKLDSPGPILFKQERMGRYNRLFHIYKFRSMHVDRTDHAGNRSASRNDDRITRLGRIMRASSLDELPQLLNVIEGDMSLVGPRPHALGSRAGDDLFWEVNQRYWLRHTIKPGITGLAQVRGYRGATEHRDALDGRLRCDLEYVSQWSLLLDIIILFRTFGVIMHEKAY